MVGNGSQELQQYKRELTDIINQLKDIEHNIRHGFKNVGNIQCADSINSVIVKYESALRTLNSVSPSTLDRLKQAAEQAKIALAKAAAAKK